MSIFGRQSGFSLSSLSPFYLLLLLILLLSGIRLLVLWDMSDFSLHYDEAQYWLWSKNLDWGYYSKPPMLAAVIALFTGLLGDSETAIRSIGLFFYPLTALVIYRMTYCLTQDSKQAFWSALIFLTMPGVALSSLLITTDVVLFLFWALSCLCFYQAVQFNYWRYWLGVGIFAGCGLMTKYTMGIFAVAAGFWLLMNKDLRRQFTNIRLYIAAGISGLIFLPNILWNNQNGWPSARHTAELSSSGVSGIHFSEAVSFLTEQLGVFGIVSFPLFLYWVFCCLKSRDRNTNNSFLLYFSATFLVIITLQALQGRAYANWAAPTYAMASIAIAALVVRSKGLKVALLVTNGLLMLLLYTGEHILDTLYPENRKGPDPMKTIKGWSDWQQRVSRLMEDCENCTVILGSRESAAQFAYQMRGESRPVFRYWNPERVKSNYYRMNYSLDHPERGRFLIILDKPLQPAMTKSFTTIQPVEVFTRTGRAGKIRQYSIYRAENFLGYSHD